MKKSDVQLNYHQGSGNDPMLNIKVHAPYPWPTRAEAEEVEYETGEEGFADWLMSKVDADTAEDLLNVWWDAACESNFEQAVDEAGEIFGDAYGSHARDKRRVWADGRSGGWLYVTGLPDVESWDAIMVGKWARYAHVVAGLVADVPRLTLELLAINRYASERDAADALDRKREDADADAMADLLRTVVGA